MDLLSESEVPCYNSLCSRDPVFVDVLMCLDRREMLQVILLLFPFCYHKWLIIQIFDRKASFRCCKYKIFVGEIALKCHFKCLENFKFGSDELSRMVRTQGGIYISNADNNNKQTLPLYSGSNTSKCAEATGTHYHAF